MSKEISIETSARHVHLTPENVEAIFGPGAELKPDRELTTPGIFVCDKRVDIVGPKGIIKNVAILGPARNYTQVELAATDARTLGIEAPLRHSGDTAGSAACRIVGPVGELVLEEGAIVAARHIHMKADMAEELGIKDRDTVSVRCGNSDRALVLENVLVRVRTRVGNFMHIDTDEANAAGIGKFGTGEILL